MSQLVEEAESGPTVRTVPWTLQRAEITQHFLHLTVVKRSPNHDTVSAGAIGQHVVYTFRPQNMLMHQVVAR